MTTTRLTIDEEKGLSKVLKKVIAKRHRTRQTRQPSWVVDEVMRVIDPSGELKRTDPERAAGLRERTLDLLSSAPPPTPLEALLNETGR
jgi:hypothetical protein